MSEEKKPPSRLDDKIDDLLLEHRRLFFSAAVDVLLERPQKVTPVGFEPTR